MLNQSLLINCTSYNLLETAFERQTYITQNPFIYVPVLSILLVTMLIYFFYGFKSIGSKILWSQKNYRRLFFFVFVTQIILTIIFIFFPFYLGWLD